MPTPLADFERARRFSSKRYGTSRILKLEVLSAQAIRLWLALYIFFLLFLFAEGFFIYRLIWSCSSFCQQKLDLTKEQSPTWNVDVDTSCRREGIPVGHTDPAYIWEAEIDVRGYARLAYLQILVANVEENLIRYGVQSVTVIQRNREDRIFDTNTHAPCSNGNPLCDVSLIAPVIETSGLYRISYSAIGLEQNTDDGINTIRGLEIGTDVVPAWCIQRTEWAILVVIVRYACLAILLPFAIRVFLKAHWRRWNQWLPEQQWVIVLLMFNVIYLNPFYFLSVFFNISWFNWIEFAVRDYLRWTLLAFEQVILASCRGETAVLCGWIYLPTFRAVSWLCVIVIVDILHFVLHGFHLTQSSGSFNSGNSDIEVSLDDILIYVFLIWWLFWYAWMIKSAYLTHKKLKNEPYLQTRPRQLAFRIWVWALLPHNIVSLWLYIWHIIAETVVHEGIIETGGTTGYNQTILSLPLSVITTISLVVMYSSAELEEVKPTSNSPKACWRNFWSGVTRWLLRKQGDLYFQLSEDGAIVSQLEGIAIQKDHFHKGLTDKKIDLPLFMKPGTKDYFCLERALIMWNMSWEVYRTEPPKHRARLIPGEAAALMAATAVCTRYREQGLNDRLQYLRQCFSVKSKMRGEAEIIFPEFECHLEHNGNVNETHQETKDEASPSEDSSSPLPDPIQLWQCSGASTPKSTLVVDDDGEAPKVTSNEGAEAEEVLNKTQAANPQLSQPHQSAIHPQTRYQTDAEDLRLVIENKKNKQKLARAEMRSQRWMKLERYGWKLITCVNQIHNQAMIVLGDGVIGVSFRGTANQENIKTDLKGLRVVHEEMAMDIEDEGGLWNHTRQCIWKPMVHSGFYKTWNALSEEVLSAADRVIKEYPEHKLYVTGHSLGGALAFLAAYAMRRRFPDAVMSVITFGAPRTGNKQFSKFYDKCLPTTFRVVNEKDVIPTLPPSFLGLMYWHVGKEVRIEARGTLLVQPSDVERLFGVAANINKVEAHHLIRYRSSLEAICDYYGLVVSAQVNPMGNVWTTDGIQADQEKKGPQ